MSHRPTTLRHLIVTAALLGVAAGTGAESGALPTPTSALARQGQFFTGTAGVPVLLLKRRHGARATPANDAASPR